jgi:hypothetical protein
MLDPLSYIDDLIAEERNEQKLLKLKSYKKILKDVHGIGTDRTRENILNTIKERGYWTLDKKGIITVTPLGWQVERALPEALKSIATTATWEIKFEEIRRGEFAFSKFIEVVDNTVMNVYIRGVFEYYQKNGFNPPKKKISNETELKCPLCGALIIEKTGAFVCSTQKYKNNKKSGCLFSIAKNQKLLEATIGLAQLQKLLAGHKLTAKNGKILSMDLENEYFTKIEGGNSPIKKEEEVGKVIETTKTFRLGGTELFVYKNQFGKDLTLKQASLVLAGEEVELKRTSKAGKPFSVTIWLEEGGKCGHSFSQ